MAESPQSTSENPQDEKLGLGLLITDTAPSDPVAVTSQFVEIQHSEASHNAPDGKSDALPEAAVEVVEKSATGDEESVLLNAIEKDLFNLIIEQAEIEPARDKLEAVDDEEEEGKGVGTVKEDNIDEVMDEQDADSVEDGDENDGGDEENVEYVREQSGDALRKSGNYNQIVNRRRNNYPMRPDAEDCAFYMKFGSCKFGMNCKFNHPPRRKSQGVKEKANNGEESSERAGQTECKYYLTSGGCKYGKDCKYFHGSDKSSTSQAVELNFLGLPIRPGEKECPYYMRTGSCKYGSNCRFHHPDPEPTAVVGGDSPLGYGNGASLPSQLVSASSMSSWSPPRAFNETSSFVPVMFPPTQVASTSNPEWNGYQAAIYPTSENSLPTPPAFAIANLTAEINLPLQQHDMLDEEYPERPGEPECSFFLKTGDCKFKSNCKFHHPKNRISKAKANSSALNDKGLPLRPDQPICTHYYRYGICKYGPACRYDHPSKFAISRPTFDQPPFGNSNFVGATELRKGSES